MPAACKSFLSSRKQIFRVGQCESTAREVSIGLPQGSTLSPVLFLIYINDFPKVSSKFNITLFADDSTLSMSDPNINTLVTRINTELVHVKEWTVANRLTVNVQKTIGLLTTNRDVNLATDYGVTFDGQLVTFAESTRYLGVQIDTDLKFDAHIKNITGKVARNTGILFKIKDNLSNAAKLSFYYGFIHPYLNYNLINWGGTHQNLIICLEKQQKRAIFYIKALRIYLCIYVWMNPISS